MDNIQEELEKLLKRYIIQELEVNEVVVNGVMIDNIITAAVDAIEEAVSSADDFVNDTVFGNNDIDTTDSDEWMTREYQIKEVADCGDVIGTDVYPLLQKSEAIAKNTDDIWKDAWGDN